MWLFGLAELAVCVFLSSLTENVIIAAVLSFACLFLSMIMPNLEQMISADGNLLTTVLGALDIPSRFDSFLNGKIDLAALVYLASVVFLFLFLTTQVLQKRRYTVSRNTLSFGAYSTGLVALVLAVTVAANLAVNQLPSSYTVHDVTESGLYSLTDDTKEYLKQLETLPPKLREAWLYGSWDVYEGQFFEDFRDVPEHYEDRQWTHVIEPFAPDKGWTVCRSYDFGYGKPFSCAWWAVDYDGVLYRILELYGCTRTPNEGVKWTPDRQFAEIRRIETEHPWLKGREITGVADPAIWDASRGESVAQTAARYGVYFTPGDNARIAGWMQCHYRLQFDENGYPRMYVFRNCRAFIRTVPLMLYSQTRPEDLDTALEDHVCDEWRYFCMSRPVRPIRGGQTAAIWSDPLDQLR